MRYAFVASFLIGLILTVFAMLNGVERPERRPGRRMSARHERIQHGLIWKRPLQLLRQGTRFDVELFLGHRAAPPNMIGAA